MNEIIVNIITSSIVIVIAIIAILQGIKGLGVEVKYIYLIGLILGVGFNVWATSLSIESVTTGLVIGMASGKLYDKLKEIEFPGLSKK